MENEPADFARRRAYDWRAALLLIQQGVTALVGISPRTLQNWERGHRHPEGTARALLRVAESHPQAVLEALHR